MEASTHTITDRQREVKATIERIGIDNIGAIATSLGISKNGVHGHIRRLRELGELAPGKGQSGSNGKAPAAAATPPTKPGALPVEPETIDAESVAVGVNADLREFVAKLEERGAAVKAEIERRQVLVKEHSVQIDGLEQQSADINRRLNAVREASGTAPAAAAGGTPQG